MKGKNSLSIEEKRKRRAFGTHMTSTDIFLKFIYPEIKDKFDDYIWVDLYAGEGNLILPILSKIKFEEREEFFQNHIYLFDIQEKMVKRCVHNAKSYGVSDLIAKKNIITRDNLESFPEFLNSLSKPIYHITNPPYLYLGYISKHESTKKLLKYFKDENSGYQDLYQIAMMNDLRNQIANLIYIIPTNFLYGASVSNKFRIDFLRHYNISKMIIFETKMFEFTGTNICINFLEKKRKIKQERIDFIGTKIYPNGDIFEKKYDLDPRFKYRAGSEFQSFLKKFKLKKSLDVNYYLMAEEVNGNQGEYKVVLLDANKYNKSKYKKVVLSVNLKTYKKIISNILYIRTVDTGSIDGRVGLNIIEEDFNVNGIYVSGNTYRTHPIQLFLKPTISIEKQKLLKKYFNFILEKFREKLDSEFLTTYKYSNSVYTRKYLGLTQVRNIIKTFPFNLNKKTDNKMESFIENNEFNNLINFLTEIHSIKLNTGK